MTRAQRRAAWRDLSTGRADRYGLEPRPSLGQRAAGVVGLGLMLVAGALIARAERRDPSWSGE